MDFVEMQRQEIESNTSLIRAHMRVSQSSSYAYVRAFQELEGFLM